MPVDTQHAEYSAMKSKWQRCRDTLSGQDAVHLRGDEYLPKLKEQEEADYDAYKKRAVFFNATSRTVEALVGMIFRKQPVVELPPAMDPIKEDATLSAIPLPTFAQKAMYEVIGLGRVGILVDFPRMAEVPKTLAEAEAMGNRPYLTYYTAENIINWRFGRVRNVYQLVQVVLQEKNREPTDEFVDEEVTRYRVLSLKTGVYTQQLWRKATSGELKDSIDGFIAEPAFAPMVNGKQLSRIPFFLVGSDGPTTETDDPPMIDLVDVNLSHYRTTADYEHGAHFCGLPTPCVSGYVKEKQDQKLYVGSTHAWIFPRPETKAYYLEFGGQGLTSLATLRAEKEQHMAALGARMLQPEKAAAEAEQTVLARASGELSVLGAMAQGLSRAMTGALELCRDWWGTGGDVSFELNTDYVPAQMTAPELTALVAAWQQGAISKETLFQNLKRGEVISEDTTFEEEDAAIGDEPPALAQQLTTLDAQHQQSLEAQEAAAKAKPKPGAK